jgi:predicted RNase H-like HicB family nuclease
MMRYPVAIKAEPGFFRVVVPDLPGCEGVGDTEIAAWARAEEALLLRLQRLIENGLPVPAPSNMGVLHDNPEFTGWGFGLLPVDVAYLEPAGARQ